MEVPTHYYQIAWDSIGSSFNKILIGLLSIDSAVYGYPAECNTVSWKGPSFDFWALTTSFIVIAGGTWPWISRLGSYTVVVVIIFVMGTVVPYLSYLSWSWGYKDNLYRLLCSIASCKLGEDPTPYYVVGTAMVNPEAGGLSILFSKQITTPLLSFDKLYF